MHRKGSRMKLDYSYKTKEGMYRITIDQEFLDFIITDLKDEVTHVAGRTLAGEMDIYRIWNLASIYLELNELKESEGV